MSDAFKTQEKGHTIRNGHAHAATVCFVNDTEKKERPAIGTLLDCIMSRDIDHAHLLCLQR